MKFQSKPRVIEAEQYWPDKKPWPKGVENHRPHGGYYAHVHTMHDNQVVLVRGGDWIVAEPDGVHFYPVQDDVFKANYEPAKELS